MINPDYFHSKLSNHLKEHLFILNEDVDTFVESRSDSAYNVFFSARQRGRTILSSLEEANEVLMLNLEYSLYDMLCIVFEAEFDDIISEPYYPVFFKDMYDKGLLDDYLPSIGYNSDFLTTPEGVYLYYDLVYLTDNYLSENGLQQTSDIAG